MNALNLFIPLAKVDEKQRLVYGVATEEIKDKSGEIFDYESSKPYFENWSNSFREQTGGKSAGCLREMHSNIAAGKLVDMFFNNDQKKIEVCSKVVDDASWKKVLEGVLTGFSVGGRYVKRWSDNGLTRYTANPVEISLVDNPCVPTAVFEVIKADGVIEQRRFKSKEDTEVNNEALTNVDKAVLNDFTKALAEKDLAKAFSFGEIENRMRAALKEQVHTPFDAGYFYIQDIYPDSVVISGNIDGDGDTDLYRLTYTIDAGGHISFTGTEMVRVEYVPTMDESGDGDNDEDDLVPKSAKPDDLKKNAEPEKPAQEPVQEPETIVAKADEVGQEDKADPEPAEIDVDTIIQKAGEAVELAKSGKALSKATLERLVKMSHTLNELGASCKCEMCAKSYAPADTATKADTADLHKNQDTGNGVLTETLEKAMQAISTLEKDVKVLKDENETLRNEVTSLKDEPMPGGPIAPGAQVLSKTIGIAASDDGPSADSDQIKAWETIEKTATDPGIKQNAMLQKATLMMKQMYAPSKTE